MPGNTEKTHESADVVDVELLVVVTVGAIVNWLLVPNTLLMSLQFGKFDIMYAQKFVRLPDLNSLELVIIAVR